MNKRNIKVMVMLFIAIVLLITAKGVLKSNDIDSTTQSSFDLKTEYERIKDTKKPAMIVFSYDADCCEKTRKFFNEYNTKAKKLMKDYEDKFETLFINTGILSENDSKLLIEIAKENGVSELPSILLIDSKRKPYKVIEGSFNEEELKAIMDGLVK